MPDAGQPPSLLEVERRGIDYIPESERWGQPTTLFGMWAGAILNIEFVVYGTLIVATLGLSFAQAVPVIILANLTYALTGVASLQGPGAGTTTFTISRAPFGRNGNRAPALFNWMTQVGFETEGVALVVLAGLALATKAGFTPGTPLKIVFVVVAAAIQMVLPLLGHASILRVLKVLTVPFIILFVLLAVLTASKADLHAARHGAGWGSLFVAAALLISAGGLGWTENANDYSRYLPPESGRRAIVTWVALGGAIPSILLEILGAAIATGVPSSTDPIKGLPHAFPGWLLVPYLIVAMVQLFAINTLDLYSSGVTLQSLGVPFRRYQAVIFDTAVCGGLAAYAVFSSRFSQLLADFLEFIIVWLAPWCAIYLADWVMRGRRYPRSLLFGDAPGAPAGWAAVNWRALVALGLGMIASALWLDASTPYVSWLSRRFDGSDFSVFTGFLVGGIAYVALAGGRLRRQARAPGGRIGTRARVGPMSEEAP